MIQLNLRYCHRLTDASVRHVAEHCVELEHLDVRYLPKLTDASLETLLAPSMRGLRSLHLSQCWGLAAPGPVVRLCGTLPRLTELFLLESPAVRGVATIAEIARAMVAKVGAKLQLLDVRRCEGLGAKEETSQALELLRGACGRNFVMTAPGLFHHGEGG